MTSTLFRISLAALVAVSSIPATLADTGGSGSFAAILPHLDPIGDAVYFEAADVSELAKARERAEDLFGSVADALLQADACDPVLADAIRNVPTALLELGFFSVKGFGRSAVAQTNGVVRTRSFWAGGEGARAWDLVATPAHAPVECLPTNAVLAFASSIDMRAALDIAKTILDSLPPDLLDELKDLLPSDITDDNGICQAFSMLATSFRPGVFAALTLDHDKPFTLDGLDDPDLPLPTPGLVVGLGADDPSLLATIRMTLVAAKVPCQQDNGPDGEVGFRILLPEDAEEEIPFAFRPTLRFSPSRKLLVIASTPDLVDAAFGRRGKGLVETSVFRTCAEGLPDEGSLRWVAPDLMRTALRVAAADDRIDMTFDDLSANVGDFWFVARSRRFADGLESVSRGPGKPPSYVRLAQELGMGSGVFAGGILAASLVSPIKLATANARATGTAAYGRGVWIAFVAANMEREALNLPPVWPAKGKWKSSTDYFQDLLDNETVADLVYDPRLFNWSCLAGDIETLPSKMPILWTSNLVLDDNDIVELGDPDNPVDWSGKVSGGDYVVIVTRGGSVHTVRRRELTDVEFFGYGTQVGTNASFQVLNPAPVSPTPQPDPQQE